MRTLRRELVRGSLRPRRLRPHPPEPAHLIVRVSFVRRNSFPRARPRLSRSGGLSTADLYALTFATTRLDVSRSSANSTESNASGSPVSKSASRRRAATSRPSAYDAGYASGYFPDVRASAVPRTRAWDEREGVGAADSDVLAGDFGDGGSIPSRSRSAARRAIARSASTRRRRDAVAIARDFFVDAHDASASVSESADADARVRTDGPPPESSRRRTVAYPPETSPRGTACAD